jgi:hypothetical protein
MTTTKQLWQIPKQYLGFEKKTLILCIARDSNKSYIAEAYLGDGTEIKVVPPLQTPDTSFAYTDKEGFNYSSHGTHGTAPGNEPHNKEHYEQVFLNFLVHELQEKQQGKYFQKLIVFTPPQFQNSLAEKLPKEILEKTTILNGNLKKAPVLELIKRIFE